MEGKKRGGRGGEVEVLDGSDIRELVDNEEVFSEFVDHKFKHFDSCNDGRLSLKKDLLPAVADIGVALGLPPPNSALVTTEVLNEFTHIKQETVSKTEFKAALSDILLTMAAGLKRDPIVILRMDGEHLQEYTSSPNFETDALSAFSQVKSPGGPLRDHIVKALQSLGVDQGLPPTSDSRVMSNVVEPAIDSCVDQENNQQSFSQQTFVGVLKKVLENIVERLREQPVIVAHTENTYDGSSIRNLLDNKFETEKVLKAALENIPRDKNGRMSTDCLRTAYNSLAPSAGMPPYGAISEMNDIVDNVIKTVNADDGKNVKEDEFKSLLLEILGSVMVQLEGKPLSVTANSVVHEPLADV